MNFQPEIAEKCGLYEAVLLANAPFVFNINDLKKIFIFWTDKQLRTLINRMIKNKQLFNYPKIKQHPFDNIKLYSIGRTQNG